jgi:COX assembly protein 2
VKLGARTQFTICDLDYPISREEVQHQVHATTSQPSQRPRYTSRPHAFLQIRHASPSPYRGSAEEYARRRIPQPRCSTNTPIDCADVVAALDECHARGFLWKVTGNCTEAKYKVNMCLRAQRLEKTRQNREIAKEKRKKIEEVWAELDANK